MGSLILITALSLVPRSGPVTEPEDLIELNHVHDGSGHNTLDQWIFWTWCSLHHRHQVVAWRRARCEPGRIPGARRVPGGWEVVWWDEDVLRRVRSRQYVETWTQIDRELVERDWRSKELRRGLRKR